MKHTILGAGGSIGNALTDTLLGHHQDVRLVSRSGFSAIGAESARADLLSFPETLNGVQHSDVVYLVAGLPYDSKIWQEAWPKVMRNAIDACKNVGATLIFFDNVYMYGRVDGVMTEATPYNPCSKKGEIRAVIARMLEEEIAHKNINAIIARSADLYGPYATKTNPPYLLAISKLMAGKTAQWMVNVNLPHSFTYTLDCANALHLLATHAEVLNQVWHMPTCAPAITGRTFIEIAAKECGIPAKHAILSKSMIKLVGLFNKTVAETAEMLYQSEQEYLFDSTKFTAHFNYQPTSYQDGIKETIRFLKEK